MTGNRSAYYLIGRTVIWGIILRDFWGNLGFWIIKLFAVFENLILPQPDCLTNYW